MPCGDAGCIAPDQGVSRADLSSLALQISAALPQVLASTPGADSRVAPVAEHGNYRRYYNYRVPDAFGEDPRLQVCSGERAGQEVDGAMLVLLRCMCSASKRQLFRTETTALLSETVP